MNRYIQAFFDAIESHLLQNPIFKAYTIMRFEIAFSEGKLRIKSLLQDGGTVEFFLYVDETKGDIHLLKYSVHWQDGQDRLIRRWDNAPHYPDLPNAPHHIHEADGSISSADTLPSIFQIFQEIEDRVIG